VVAEAAGPAGVVTRAGVATKWRAANSGDHFDNLAIAHPTVLESKPLSRRVRVAYSPAMMLARWSRWSMTFGSCGMKPIASRTSNRRLTRCGPTAARRASLPKLRRR
jgi:hypothetical protein